jgi:hypothetical protein
MSNIKIDHDLYFTHFLRLILCDQYDVRFSPLSARCQVHTAVDMRTTAISDVTSCILVARHQRFEKKIYFLHLQGRKLPSFYPDDGENNVKRNIYIYLPTSRKVACSSPDEVDI